VKYVSLAISAIDRFTDWTGRMVSWLTLAMVLMTLVVVVLRYYFQSGSIALQESITYLHGLVFMLGIAFTLQRGGHVRVDIFYRGFSPQKKALVDLIGGLLCSALALPCSAAVMCGWIFSTVVFPLKKRRWWI